MFSLMPYAFSWTGVFNQDYIQEAQACFSVLKAVWDVRRGSRCRPRVCDEERVVTSEESLQTAFNNRKYITRRTSVYASPNSAVTRLVDGLLSSSISRPIPLLSLRLSRYVYLHCYSYTHIEMHLYARARIDDLHDRCTVINFHSWSLRAADSRSEIHHSCCVYSLLSHLDATSFDKQRTLSNKKISRTQRELATYCNNYGI